MWTMDDGKLRKCRLKVYHMIKQNSKEKHNFLLSRKSTLSWLEVMKSFDISEQPIPRKMHLKVTILLTNVSKGLSKC